MSIALIYVRQSHTEPGSASLDDQETMCRRISRPPFARAITTGRADGLSQLLTAHPEEACVLPQNLDKADLS